ncbi:MAG: hypothetical protein ACR2MQ_16625 [Gemmatimonadaceae bacterium]
MVRSPSYGIEQPDTGQNLYAILRERARDHSRAHLAIEAVLSVAATLVVVFQRSSWWALYLPLMVIACYSLWGLLDRATRATPGEPFRTRFVHRAVLGVDWIVVAAGTLSALVFFFFATGYLLGNWIH